MNTLLSRGAAIGVAALCIGAPVSAQGLIEINRKMEGLAVTRALGGVGWDVTAVFTAEVSTLPVGPATQIDWSTDVLLIINGVQVASVGVDLTYDSATYGGACNCGEGATNGMAASLLCIDGQCQFPPIKAEFPGVPAESGDEIMVLLMPASGAVPDSGTSADDLRSATFNGSGVGWRRQIETVEVQPGPGGTADLLVRWNVGVIGATGPHRVGARIEVLINGAPAGASSSACDDWIATPNSPCSFCIFDPCGTSSCAGTDVQMWCRAVDVGEGQGGCACLADSTYSVIPGLVIEPEDEILVILRPAPGALPELPGFPDEDSMCIPATALCPGDIDGDGDIDGADLAALLGGWGSCGGPK